MIGGNRVSPILPAGKNYLIDIDGTVGEDIPNEEPERMVTAEAYPDAIETINRWYGEGPISASLRRGLKIIEMSQKSGFMKKGSTIIHY